MHLSIQSAAEAHDGCRTPGSATARRAQLADRRSASVVQPTIAAGAPALRRHHRHARRPSGRVCRLAGSLAKNLRDSAIADVLQAICDLDLGELQAVEPPRGFGRD